MPSGSIGSARARSSVLPSATGHSRPEKNLAPLIGVLDMLIGLAAITKRGQNLTDPAYYFAYGADSRAMPSRDAGSRTESARSVLVDR